MKKVFILLISLLIVPLMVNAKSRLPKYDVCDSCEFTSLADVLDDYNQGFDNDFLYNQNIVINIDKDISESVYFNIGNQNRIAKSFTINGNNHNLSNVEFYVFANEVYLNNINNLFRFGTEQSQKVEISNTNISTNVSLHDVQETKLSKTNINTYMELYYNNEQLNNEQINLSDILEIDSDTLSALNHINLSGNIKIENMDFRNLLLQNSGGTISVFNSKLRKVINIPDNNNATTNIYNSKFESLKYKNILRVDDIEDEFGEYLSSYDLSKLNYDVYDINEEDAGLSRIANTTIYFDTESNVKAGNKLSLVNCLDYYTEDKEIEYTIEDESIAKIENKELIGLKEGSTKVTVTTDDGHVIYRINLVVEKESIPEKINKMTIKVPITGSKIKLWVLVIGGILLGIALICVYMLIKRKK